MTSRRMRRILFTLALLFVASPAVALDCGDTDTYGYVQGVGGGFYLKADRSGPYALDSNCVGHLMGGGGEGSSASIATAQVSVASTATLVAAARTGRGAVIVTNLGAVAVYLGAAGVTTSTGTLLPGVVGASVTIPTSAEIYGVDATGTQAVSVVEVY